MDEKERVEYFFEQLFDIGYLIKECGKRADRCLFVCIIFAVFWVRNFLDYGVNFLFFSFLAISLFAGAGYKEALKLKKEEIETLMFWQRSPLFEKALEQIEERMEAFIRAVVKQELAKRKFVSIKVWNA